MKRPSSVCARTPAVHGRAIFVVLVAWFFCRVAKRKVIHVYVTRAPTNPWVAQQLRRPLRMDKHQNVSFGITIRNSDKILQEMQRRVASKCFERPTGRATGKSYVLTFSGQCNARMPGLFPDFPGEATLLASQRVYCLFQSSSPPSRA
jgi:hypothetical protein